ncbi:MAG: hypothetical protein CVV25_11435 [Ignavibacteriae bacterium HGW-Ignavibacteriae-4]|jgi:hypothetical protein|nr:MAG: hypothetical protein CVV25_11435 [Ignavibacteriae bacterium HGW-Ignavibacteriae-4]
MNTKIKQAIIGGLVGTAVMTIVMMVAPMMGMPKMSPPHMLSMMLGVPAIVGWMMHFMTGVMFAMGYAFIFIDIVKKVNNNILKGVLFGLAAFIFAQIMMAVMGMMMPMPPMEGSKMLLMIASIMGHVIFGVTVTQFVKVKE